MLSNDSSNNVNNINAKYSRLILDYKSLRDKHNLLKNALILERERTKELESLISDSDLQRRKSLQEQESLAFRNDLLTKQINSLRDELERERQRKSKKLSLTKGREVNPTSEELEVIKEELINKISECSTLHSQISNMQFDYQMETNNFRSAINDLESQLRLVKDQCSHSEVNIRKTLAQEINERTALENKLEQKDSLISRLENSESQLKSEIHELKAQLASRGNYSPFNHDNKCDESDRDSVRSKDVLDKKTSGSLNDSINDAQPSSSEIYISSLLDKIGLLEQKINSLELANQITNKRMKMDKSYRDLYETFISENGFELPSLVQKKDSSVAAEELYPQDGVCEAMARFYEQKFLSLNRQIYQAVAKAAIYYDEARGLDCHLESLRAERDSQRCEIDDLKRQIRTNEEDLEITRTQYDTKMCTLSMHVADLSARLEAEGQWGAQPHPPAGDNVSSIKNFINSLKK